MIIAQPERFHALEHSGEEGVFGASTQEPK